MIYIINVNFVTDIPNLFFCIFFTAFHNITKVIYS